MANKSIIKKNNLFLIKYKNILNYLKDTLKSKLIFIKSWIAELVAFKRTSKIIELTFKNFFKIIAALESDIK